MNTSSTEILVFKYRSPLKRELEILREMADPRVGAKKMQDEPTIYSYDRKLKST